MTMKKLSLTAVLMILLCLLLTPLSAFAAGDSAAILSDVSAKATSGSRVFDLADVLTQDEEAELESRLSRTVQKTGMDAAVLTVNGTGYSDIKGFSDYIYSYSGLGAGEKRSGTLFVMDMEQRDFYLFTYGTAIDYYTDRALAYIEDDLMLTHLKSGNYAAAFGAYADGLDQIYDEGLQGNKKKGFKLWKLLASILAGCGIGTMPVSSVKRKYAMQAEKRLAEGFNLAYRAGALLTLARPQTDRKMVDRFEQVVPIQTAPKPQAGHGGGVSTTHTSIGGGVHGGRGGKF